MASPESNPVQVKCITKSCAEGPAVQDWDAERAERSSDSLRVA